MDAQTETAASTSDVEQIVALRDSVAAFAGGTDALKRARAHRERLPGYDVAVWKAMARLGWTGIMVPESLGGLGLGLAEAVVVAEELGRVVAPEPFVAAAVLATTAIVRGDNAALQARLLPGVLDGSLLPALAWQEQGGDFDPASVTLQARRDGAETILSGCKRFVAGAGAANGFILSARSVDGVELHWVARDAPGLEIAFDGLTDGGFAATLTLQEVRVPATDRIAGTGADAILAEALDLAAITAGAELLGIGRKAFAITLDYMRVRSQFGRPIGSFQALQHRAVDCWMRIELAAAVLEEAVAQSAQSAARAAAASRVKARCGDAALLATREAIQLHGAIGFTDECDVGLYVKRALTVSAWLGGVHHHRRRFAHTVPIDRRNASEDIEWPGLDQLRVLPADADWNALDDEGFRHLLRDFIHREYPPELRFLPRRVRWHEVRDWNLKLAARGWIAPAWPRSQGGMELSPAKQLIYIDEFERGGVGRAPDQGVRQLGPVLMRYGTSEQKQHWLPKILTCEHIWCQGYSEPNAGSDLASVSTSAVIEGDEIVINGQKIWTSMAMDSTHIYVLCRTDKTVKKQAGLSFVIADLTTPGITVRPIRDIAGHEEFAQVFFDNVRVPANQLIGDLNNGWTVAKAVLDFERLGIGSPHRPSIAFRRLTSLASGLGLFEDVGFLDEYTRLRLDLLDHTALYGRFAEAASRGERLGPEASILKLWAMEMFQRISEFALDRAGAHGALPGPFAVGGAHTDLMTPYYMSRLATIGGGSSEILRNVLAKRVLDLPG